MHSDNVSDFKERLLRSSLFWYIMIGVASCLFLFIEILIVQEPISTISLIQTLLPVTLFAWGFFLFIGFIFLLMGLRVLDQPYDPYSEANSFLSLGVGLFVPIFLACVLVLIIKRVVIIKFRLNERTSN